MTPRIWMIMLCIVLLTADSSIAVNKTMSPMEALQGSFDQIILILNDPSYKAGQKKAIQRNKIWRIARLIFNFDEISRRAVGKPWNNFSPEEKKRFSGVFSEFLGSTYIDKFYQTGTLAKGQIESLSLRCIAASSKHPTTLSNT